MSATHNYRHYQQERTVLAIGGFGLVEEFLHNAAIKKKNTLSYVSKNNHVGPSIPPFK